MPQSKLLLSLVIISVAAVVFLPVYILAYLYPAIDKLLILDAENHARNVAGHFSLHLDVPGGNLRYDDITPDLKKEIALTASNFSLEKLKVFSASGEILYSTTPEEIGGMNDQDYFRSVVMRGKNFTKLVSKNTETLEGRTVARDVIETYVPIFGRDRVVGAFEIYYDITDLREKFGSLIHRSTFIVYGVSFLLITSLLVSLVILSRNISARQQAEESLARRGEELEKIAGRRTAEISAANRQIRENIKEREEIEQNLRISEERHRSLIEMADDAIFIADAESGLITDVNRKATELVGRPRAEIIGTRLLSLHPAGDDDLYARLVKNHYAEAPHNITLYVQHSSGRTIPVEITSFIFDYGNGRSILAIFRDITQRLQNGEELRMAERIRSATLLAGGIAHDFNSLLTAMLANVSVAQLEAAGNEDIMKRLQSMEETVNRARGMTQQLLTFARGGRSLRKPVRPGRIIEESVSSVLHGTAVQCDCKIAPDLWPVNADADQIRQVVGNIVLNASEAMEGRGLCRITGENIVVDEHDSLLLPGRYIRIIVSDEGHGIAGDRIDRIFDPFYTTKPPQARGLGLSSAYAIVSNHGGRIQVESVAGKGSTFSVYLPASADPSVEEELENGETDRQERGENSGS